TINILQNQEELRRQHDRRAMLKMVKQFWIDGVLEKSLVQATQIKLHLQLRPDAVDNQTWDEIVQLPQDTAVSTPTAATIVDLFYGMSALNRSLLILGAPGSGKTTMLLNLAQQALARAAADPAQPIPVVFNLASWGVKRRPIADWLVDELNNKYIVPGKVGDPWVENDELLLLLDGLDEVETAHQVACVQAINQFQHTHRMPIVVCVRDNEYEPLPVRLQLQTAVFLQSLTLEQLNEYIHDVGGEEVAALGEWLQRDTWLQELAQTPLILNTMLRAYQDVSLAALASLDTRAARQHYLFDAYVQRMFRHGSPQQLFPQEQTIRWLSWLARGMDEHSQAIFLIERLQPGWLASRAQRWLHLLLSRLAISLISGLLGGVILGVGFAVFFDLTMGRGLMRGLSEGLLSCLIGGLAVVVIDGVRLERSGRSIANAGRHQYGRLTLHIVVVGTAVYVSVWLALGYILGGVNWMGIDQTFWFTEGSLVGLLVGLCYSLIFGFSTRGDRQVLTEDVQTVEYLSWSRPGAWIGAAYGLIAGLVSGLFLWLLPLSYEFPDALTSLFAHNRILLLTVPILTLAGAVFGGLTGRIVQTTTTPNQGIRLSAVNAAVLGGSVGVFFGLLGGIIGWLLAGATAGLTLAAYGSFFGLLAAIWYGGLDVVKHLSLRLILVRNGRIPFRTAQFLDYATERILMRHVGGGFIFIHRLLADYFAGRAADQSEQREGKTKNE
ncbi:MAG: NACHT domain-containing protein, partial [Anaerolineae bacterium]